MPQGKFVARVRARKPNTVASPAGYSGRMPASAGIGGMLRDYGKRLVSGVEGTVNSIPLVSDARMILGSGNALKRAAKTIGGGR